MRIRNKVDQKIKLLYSLLRNVHNNLFNDVCLQKKKSQLLTYAFIVLVKYIASRAKLTFSSVTDTGYISEKGMETFL